MTDNAGIRFYTREFPLLHKTWDKSEVHPLVKEALIMRGASYVGSSTNDMHTGNEYVLKALQSSLRDRIFREFVSPAPDATWILPPLIYFKGSFSD